MTETALRSRQIIAVLAARLVRVALRGWLGWLVVACACAALAGSAASSWIEAKYFAPSEQPAIPVVAGAHVIAPTKGTRGDGRDLVRRDMFCSSCEPPADIDDDVAPGHAYAPAGVLIATSISGEPRCTVRALDTAAQGSYGIGDVIPGVGRVVEIQWHSVELVDLDGRHGRLDLLDREAAARGDPGAATLGAAAAAEAPWAGRIRKIDDHTFAVDRALVRELVGGAMKPGGAHASPIVDKDGKLAGFRMSGVRPDSLAAALGVQSGDQLAAINNTPVTSLQQLMALYTQVDQLNVVEVAGTRADGKPLALSFHLQ